MSQARILFVDQTAKLGGAELCLFDTAVAYRDTAGVMLFQDGPLAGLMRSEGIAVKTLDGIGQVGAIRKESRIITQLIAGPALFRIVRAVADCSRSYDVVYANTQKAFVAAALATRRVRRPLIYHLHDMLTASHFSAVNRRLAVLLANRYAAAVIANSQATADAFVASGGKAAKVTVVHNGIDPHAYDQAFRERAACVQRIRAEVGAADAPLLGVFSRLAPWKGQHVAIEALAALSREPKAHLLLVGEAMFGEEAYVGELKAQVARLGLGDRVHFLGFRRDVPAVMQACEVVIHCSTAAEPFGRVIVEGMLSGRPVVASDAGGAREILTHGRHGLMTPPGDADKLGASVERLLDDEAATTGMVRQAGVHARATFGRQAMLSAVDSVVEGVMQETSPRTNGKDL